MHIVVQQTHKYCVQIIGFIIVIYLVEKSICHIKQHWHGNSFLLFEKITLIHLFLTVYIYLVSINHVKQTGLVKNNNKNNNK